MVHYTVDSFATQPLTKIYVTVVLIKKKITVVKRIRLMNCKERKQIFITQSSTKLFISLEIGKKNIVEHCDDLQYLFTAAHIPRIKDETSAEGQVVTKFTKLLYSFAKNG